MNFFKNKADTIALGLLAVLLAASFLTFSPAHVPVPHRDSGIFLNIGADLLQGKLLYRDTWDNKQPLLYAINALGLWLGGGSVWGVWSLELGFFALLLFKAYRMVRAALTPLAGFAVVAGGYLATFQFMSGNFSEEYALLFQVGILATLLLVYLPERNRLARPFAALGMGALSGLVFCIKQTYLDVAAAALIFLVFLAWVERSRRILGHVLLVGLGFVLVNLPVLGYFWFKGGLRDYLVAAFWFNRSYSDLGLLEWIPSILEKLERVSTQPVLALAGSVWLVTVLLLMVRSGRLLRALLAQRVTRWALLAASIGCLALFALAQLTGESSGVGLLQWTVLAVGAGLGGLAVFLIAGKPAPAETPGQVFHAACTSVDWRRPGPAALLFLGMADLPLVVVSIALSGKDFAHYFISLFPALILLLAGGLAVIQPVARRLWLNSALIAVLMVTGFAPMLQIGTYLRQPGEGDARSAAASYLQSVTRPDQPILVWGWESGIYFLAQRQAPTRFAFPFALYQASPYQEYYAGILLRDLQQNPPAYILDLLDAGMPLIEGRPAETCATGSRLESAGLQAVLNYVCEHYAFDRTLEGYNLYRLKNNP